MKPLFIVVDTSGGGRLVGVFDSEAEAKRVIGPYGHYYKLVRGNLNELNPEIVGWATSPEQRDHLRRLIEGSVASGPKRKPRRP